MMKTFILVAFYAYSCFIVSAESDFFEDTYDVFPTARDLLEYLDEAEMTVDEYVTPLVHEYVNPVLETGRKVRHAMQDYVTRMIRSADDYLHRNMDDSINLKYDGEHALLCKFTYAAHGIKAKDVEVVVNALTNALTVTMSFDNSTGEDSPEIMKKIATQTLPKNCVVSCALVRDGMAGWDDNVNTVHDDDEYQFVIVFPTMKLLDKALGDGQLIQEHYDELVQSASDFLKLPVDHKNDTINFRECYESSPDHKQRQQLVNFTEGDSSSNLTIYKTEYSFTSGDTKNLRSNTDSNDKQNPTDSDSESQHSRQYSETELPIPKVAGLLDMFYS